LESAPSSTPKTKHFAIFHPTHFQQRQGGPHSPIVGGEGGDGKKPSQCFKVQCLWSIVKPKDWMSRSNSLILYMFTLKWIPDLDHSEFDIWSFFLLNLNLDFPLKRKLNINEPYINLNIKWLKAWRVKDWHTTTPLVTWNVMHKNVQYLSGFCFWYPWNLNSLLT